MRDRAPWVIIESLEEPMTKPSRVRRSAPAFAAAFACFALFALPPSAAQEAVDGYFRPVHPGAVHHVSVSPDGSLAAFASYDEVTVWRTADARILARRRFDRSLSALGWAEDGSLAVFLPRSPAFLLDPGTLGTRRLARTGQLGASASIAAGGRRALAGSDYDGANEAVLALVDLAGGAPTEVRCGVPGQAFALSPDGGLAFFWTRDKPPAFLEVPGGSIRSLPFDFAAAGYAEPLARPDAAAWSPDASVVAMEFVFREGRQTLFFNVDSGALLGSAVKEGVDPFFLGFSGVDASGSPLAAFALEGALRVVPVSALSDPEFDPASVPGHALPPEGVSNIVAADFSSGVAVFGNKKGGVAFVRSDGSPPLVAGEWATDEPFLVSSGGVWAAAYGDWIATGAIPETESAPTHPADIVSGRRALPGAAASVALPEDFRLDRLRFGAGGKVLLASSSDEVLAFDAAGLEPLGRATGFGERPLEIDASADGRFILVTPEDGPTRIYRSADGALVAKLPFEPAWVEGSRGFFSADGSVAVLEPGSSSIVFYEASSGRRVGLLALGAALAPGAALASQERNWAAVPLATGEYALIDLRGRAVRRAAWPEWPILAFWEEEGRPTFAGVDRYRDVRSIDARNGEELYTVRVYEEVFALLPVGDGFRAFIVDGKGRAVLPSAGGGKD